MDPKPLKIQVFEDGDELDRFAAELITSLAQDAVERRGIFHLVLSGGGTPRPIYGLLGQSSYCQRFPWSDCCVYWGDERNVPPDDSGSNYGQARISLLDKVPIPAANIYRIKGEMPPVAAAADYRQTLLRLGDGELQWPIFDVVLLGMGDDGHTASLFPGPIDPEEEQSPVMAIQADYADRPANRVTLTPLAFNTSRKLIFIVKGGSKAEAVNGVLNGPWDTKRWPIHRIRPSSGEVVWLVDKEAAAGNL